MSDDSQFDDLHNINNILRLDYIPSYTFCLLVAIYINGLNILNHIDILFAFIFIAISANTLNDFIDLGDAEDLEAKKRLRYIRRREMFLISALSLIFGLLLFVRPITEHMEIGIYIIIYGILMLSYGVTKRKNALLGCALLSIAFTFIPYLIIMTDASQSLALGDLLLIIGFVPVTILAQGASNEILDGEAMANLPRKTQIALIIGSTLFIGILGAFLWDIYHDVYVMIPALFMIIFILADMGRMSEGQYHFKRIQVCVGMLIFSYIAVLIFLDSMGMLLHF